MSARRSQAGSAIRAVSPPHGPGHLGAGPSEGPTGSAGPTPDRQIRRQVDRLLLRVHGHDLAVARVAAALRALTASAGPVDAGLARLHRARARALTARSRSPR